MITIKEATNQDYKIIDDIARRTWPATYGAILDKVQLDYMLDTFYNEKALQANFANGHRFLLIEEDGVKLGFAAYEHGYKGQNTTRIHKIYILPETQGKGIGKKMIDYIENLALENKSAALSLNVNRFNKALTFYQKLGFEIIAEVDIELDHGYLMEDYVMEKKL